MENTNSQSVKNESLSKEEMSIINNKEALFQMLEDSDNRQSERQELEQVLMTMASEIEGLKQQLSQLTGQGQGQDQNGGAVTPMNPDNRQANIENNMLQNLGKSMGIGANNGQ